MHTIGSISIPADSTVAMVPDGYHMLITGAGPIRGGKDITLTLVFAHAGRVLVVAQVTDPSTGGSSYFLN
jgi:copper(I)-binding protein